VVGFATQEVTPAPSVWRMFVFEPAADGSWKTIPAPAAVATFKTPLPLVAPSKVNWPPVPVLVPDSNTPDTSKLVPVATPITGVVRVMPAKVKAALALFIATPVVPMYIVCPMAAKVVDKEVPPTVGMLVLSKSVNQPLVTLASVAAKLPVMANLFVPRANVVAPLPPMVKTLAE